MEIRSDNVNGRRRKRRGRPEKKRSDVDGGVKCSVRKRLADLRCSGRRKMRYGCLDHPSKQEKNICPLKTVF